MNYLFLILGIDSYYDSMIMMKIIDQMPLECGIYCMSSDQTSKYFASDEKLFKIVLLEGDLSENKALFFDIVEKGQISAVFILDYHKTFFTNPYNHDYQIIPFDLAWLEDVKVPLNVIDYLDVLDYNIHNQLYLTSSNTYNVEDDSLNVPIDPEKDKLYDKIMTDSTFQQDTHNANVIESEPVEKEDMISKTNISPNIIKLCPPAQSQKENEFDKFIFLDYSKTDFSGPETERMKLPLGITEDKKNVLVLFSYQFLQKSISEGLQAHYPRVLEALIIYLKELDINLNLFVIGPDSNFGKNVAALRGSKINFRAFTTLSNHVYKTLMSSAHVVITDTIWHPSLVDAASLKIPAGVIGSGVQILEDGSVDSNFESTNLEVFSLMEKGVQDFPNTFFPFDSYPLRSKTYPIFTFYEDKFLYYLLDIYSDESVVSFLGEFLVSQSAVLETLNERQDIYNKKADLAINIDDLLQKFYGLSGS